MTLPQPQTQIPHLIALDWTDPSPRYLGIRVEEYCYFSILLNLGVLQIQIIKSIIKWNFHFFHSKLLVGIFSAEKAGSTGVSPSSEGCWCARVLVSISLSSVSLSLANLLSTSYCYGIFFWNHYIPNFKDVEIQIGITSSGSSISPVKMLSCLERFSNSDWYLIGFANALAKSDNPSGM